MTSCVAQHEHPPDCAAERITSHKGRLLAIRMSMQESIQGLSSLMALGYLNLSNNPLSLEDLRPLAHAHILELLLGSVRSGEDRRRTLSLLPNVWVLDNEYVTAREHRTAEDDYALGAEERTDHLLRTWNDSPLSRSPEKLRDGGGVGGRHSDSRKEVRNSHQQTHPKTERGGGSGFGSLETQGRQARDFFESVLWKLPSRCGASGSRELL